MASICCSPPLMLPGRLVAALAAGGGTRSYQRSMSARDLAVLAGDRAEPEVLLDGEVDERAPALGHVGDALPRRSPRATCRAIGVPSKVISPLTRDHPADGPQRGGLAGAVGAEDDDDLALVDREVDAVQHLHRAVAAVHGPSARAAPSGGRPQVGLDDLRVVADDARAAPSAILRPKSSTTMWSEIAITIAMWCSTSRIGEVELVADRPDGLGQLVDLAVGQAVGRLVEHAAAGARRPAPGRTRSA